MSTATSNQGSPPDPGQNFPVRFHTGGKFIRDKGYLEYLHEIETEVSISRDVLSYNELREYAHDVYDLERDSCIPRLWLKLFWLVPGKTFDDGIMFLGSDKAIKKVESSMPYGETADIFVEEMGALDVCEAEAIEEEAEEEEVQRADVETHLDAEEGSPEKEVQPEKDVETEAVEIPVTETYSRHNEDSPEIEVQPVCTAVIEDLLKEGFSVQKPKKLPVKRKVQKPVADNQEQPNNVEVGGQQEFADADDAPPIHNSDSDSDSDYEPIPEDSEDDSEAEQVRKLAREIRRNERNKKLGRGNNHFIKDNDVVAGDSEDEKFDDSSDSEEFNSDDDYSYSEDSDGEGGVIMRRKKSFWPRYNKHAEKKFTLGMVFRSREQMKKALIRYGIAEHHHLAFRKDEYDKVRAHCTFPGCKWMIYASRTTKNKWLQVSTFNDIYHCVPRRDNRLVTSSVIAKKFGRLIVANPTWKLEHMQGTVLLEFGVDVTIPQCKRAKQLVFQKLMDSTQGEYSQVFDYQLAVLQSNPGSTVAVKLDPDQPEGTHVFQRFYMCFAACKKGFLAGCRKVIGLDGCFFKGACFGQLLCALGRDGNNQMYPVAWAIVEKENHDSWFWFLALLNKDLKIANQAAGWVFISDQQKGLLQAIEEIMPNAENRMCARHIYHNWKKRHPNHDLQKLFWRCAKSPNKILFNYNRAKLALFTEDGAKDMMNTDPEHWSRAFMRIGLNCDSVDNNMCESFNHYIIESRYLPVISMLEWIRRKITVRVQQNRAKSAKWKGTICPNIFKKMKQNITRSTNCEVLWNGKQGFEVQEHNKYRFTVNLEKRICTCRYFQLAGLPCCHAVSAIYNSSKNIDDYIADCYSIAMYNKVYDHCLEPMEGPESWPTADQPRPKPPGYIKLPGRPKTERKREDWEAPKGTKLSRVGIKITCSKCQKKGHNISSCTNNPVAKHHGNEHVVRARTKKRKEQKYQAEAESAKRAKAAEDAARERKGKYVAVQKDPVTTALARKPGALRIPGRNSQPTAPFAPPRPTAAPHQKSFTKYMPEPAKTSTRHDAPNHTVFNLAAYKAAKESTPAADRK